MERDSPDVLTSEEYLQLCIACDDILHQNNTDPARIANYWLHVIRPHPEFFVRYKDLYVSRGTILDLILRESKRVRYWLSFVWNLAVSLFFSASSSSKQGRTEVDVLIVSHLVNASHAGKEEDFYFPGVAKALADAGYSVMIALINHTRNSPHRILRKWPRESDIKRTVLEPTITFLQELKIANSLIRDSIKIERQKKGARGFLRKIYAAASIESLSGSSFASMRTGWQVAELADEVKAKAVLVTFEGHSFERSIFSSLFDLSRNILRVAYQHSIIFEKQHAVKRFISERFDPDLILASGDISKKMFQELTQNNNIDVDLLGSNRSGRLNIRHVTTKKHRKKTCLILSEGYYSECITLFEFSLSCAREYPDVDFVWRFHPLLSFDKLIAIAPQFKEMPSNITVSDREFEDDIGRTTFALYRGSTAIIRAVYEGVIPLYYWKRSEISIDPLISDVNDARIIKSVEDFGNTLDNYIQMGDRELVRCFSNLDAACSGLYSPVQLDVIQRYVD